jgi:hypothetical protein
MICATVQTVSLSWPRLSLGLGTDCFSAPLALLHRWMAPGDMWTVSLSLPSYSTVPTTCLTSPHLVFCPTHNTPHLRMGGRRRMAMTAQSPLISTFFPHLFNTYAWVMIMITASCASTLISRKQQICYSDTSRDFRLTIHLKFLVPCALITSQVYSVKPILWNFSL